MPTAWCCVYGGFPSLPAPMATRMPSSRLTYQEWQRQAQAFESIAAFHETNFRETGVDRPRVVGAELVSSNFLSLLGAKARVGRLFRSDEETPGADHVAVLSDRYFEQRFHRSPEVIGKSDRVWRRRLHGDRRAAGRLRAAGDLRRRESRHSRGVHPAVARLDPAGGRPADRSSTLRRS